MGYASKRFSVIILSVFVSGLSQGISVPLIAIILEEMGVSSTANGLHAIALYLGIMLASPFMEKPLHWLGYRKMIVIGGTTVMMSFLLFPAWHSLAFWFVLRMFIGIGDQFLHFSAQTWLTDFSTQSTRGRSLSLYGLSYTVGFAIGPLLVSFVQVDIYLPFLISAGLSLLAWVPVLFLRDEFPERHTEKLTFTSTFIKLKVLLRYAWLFFLPSFLFGYIEASLNNNFPVFALRESFEISWISIILTSFAIGTIVTQYPLGVLSDRYGRRKMLELLSVLGAISFFFAGRNPDEPLYLLLSIFLAGACIGSFYSLGIAFMADAVPRSYLPAGNLLVGIAYSVGSISGPFLGGIAIERLPAENFFYLFTGLLLFAFVCFVLFGKYKPAALYR